jgi:hypothetical protein
MLSRMFEAHRRVGHDVHVTTTPQKLAFESFGKFQVAFEDQDARHICNAQIKASKFTGNFGSAMSKP